MAKNTEQLIDKLITKINLKLGFVKPFYAEEGAFTYEKNISGYQLQKYVGDSGAITNISNNVKSKQTFYEMLCIFMQGMQEMDSVYVERIHDLIDKLQT